jgi:hypothetical protein
MVNQQKIRIILVGFIGLCLLGIIYYVATHGRVSVTNLGSDTVSIVKINKQSRDDIVDVKNGSFLRSGEYVVRNQSAETDRMAFVEVKGWLRTTTVTYETVKAAQTSRVAGLTYENLFRSDTGALVSYSDLTDYTPGYTTHPVNDAFGARYSETPLEEELFSPVATNDGRILGYHEGSLFSYSFKDQKLSPLGNGSVSQPTREEAEADITLFPEIHRSSDMNSSAVGILQKTDKTLRVFKGSTETRYPAPVKNTRATVFDVNDKGFVYIDAASDVPEDAAAEHEEEPIRYTAKLYDFTSKQTRDVALADAIAVSHVALSPDGKYVASLHDGELWVYEVSSGRVVMANPFTPTNQLYWRGSKLYALTNETGLNVYDTASSQMVSLNIGASDKLSFTNVIPQGSKLYVTAYNTNQDSELPDGYVIDLEKADDGLTGILASKLPITGSSYDINYLGNTVFVRINYYPRNGNSPEAAAQLERLKNQAASRLKQEFGNKTLSRLTIVYQN